MTATPTRTVEDFKAEGLFFTAGALAFQIGLPRSYGCHYGMRSTKDADAAEFYRGYDAADGEPNRALLTETNEAHWVAQRCDGTERGSARAYWVHITSGRSVAKPGVAGFYAPSVAEARKQLAAK